MWSEASCGDMAGKKHLQTFPLISETLSMAENAWLQVSFQLENDADNAEMVAWTTTPWYDNQPSHSPTSRQQP